MPRQPRLVPRLLRTPAGQAWRAVCEAILQIKALREGACDKTS
jgi:hypothetical protein